MSLPTAAGRQVVLRSLGAGGVGAPIWLEISLVLQLKPADLPLNALRHQIVQGIGGLNIAPAIPYHDGAIYANNLVKP